MHGFRGDRGGPVRPFDWETLAAERDVPAELARALHADALRRVREAESDRSAEAIYVELLEQARQVVPASSAGKLTRTARRYAECAGRRARTTPVAPGKRTLTSSLGPPDRSGPRPLPEVLQAHMERTLGGDLGDVVIHPDSPEVPTGQHAFARGREIHFDRDRYQPHTQKGLWLLGHELAHVIQQSRRGQPSAGAAELEAEASRGAAAAVAGRPARIELAAPSRAAQAYSGDDGEAHIAGKPVRQPGIVHMDDGVNLRAQPLPGEQSRVIRRLPFNTALFVDTETDDGWYHVTLATGEFGYVVKTHVKTNLPEPSARLHRVEPGQSAIEIAELHYRDQVAWGTDLRFYVNVLEYVNRGTGERGVYKQRPDDDWEHTRTRAGYLIWIPGAAFAHALQGRVASGSITHAAWTAVKDAATAVGEFLAGAAAFIAGVLHGALESLWDILVGLKDLGVMIWKLLASVFTGQILSDAKSLYEQIASLDVGALIEGWLDDFEAKWNHKSIWTRWHFRGWVIGYAIMEVLLMFVSVGSATAVKWAGKAARLGRAIASLPKVQKVIHTVKSIKVPPKVRAGLDKVFGVGDELGDVARLKDKLLAKLSADARLALDGVPDEQLARIAMLHDKQPDAVDDILRAYYHKVGKKGDGDPAALAQHVEDRLAVLAKTSARGYPFGFSSPEAFQQFKSKIVAALRKYDLPADDVAVHGSSVVKKTPNDIDVAVLVDRKTFDKIADGIKGSTDKINIHKRLSNDVSKGKLSGFLFERKFKNSSFGAEIHGAAGQMKVQISIVLRGGPFDIGPYIRF